MFEVCSDGTASVRHSEDMRWGRVGMAGDGGGGGNGGREYGESMVRDAGEARFKIVRENWGALCNEHGQWGGVGRCAMFRATALQVQVLYRRVALRWQCAEGDIRYGVWRGAAGLPMVECPSPPGTETAAAPVSTATASAQRYFAEGCLYDK